MQETFERVTERRGKVEVPVKHLYRRQYQMAGGDWSTIYYAIFTDWKGKRGKFAAGDSLDDARDELGRLRTLNKGRFDWDAEKRQAEEQRRRAVTLSQWGNTYFSHGLSPNELRPGSADREKGRSHCWSRSFGDLSLLDIKKSTVLEYRKKRAAEGVGFVTINRELSFLRKLLNVAADQEPPLLETVPRFKLPNEAPRARTKTIDAEDFAAILSHMRRPAQRYLITLFETSMRLNEPMKLKWDMVDLKAGLLRLPAEIVKEKHPRRTPISWEFRQILEEMRAEQRKIPNLEGYVFTRKNGQPIVSIRTAFEKARHEAKLDHVIPHDLRRTAITRWTDLRIPRDFVMAASGHKPSNVHDRYLNFPDKQLTDAFQIVMVSPEHRQKLFPWCSQTKAVENSTAASY
jgi:integrase